MIKNKKILFVTDSCPPNLTMSGVVMKNIIDYLADSNSFDIVAIRQGKNDVLEYKGRYIKYIKSFPYFIITNRYRSNTSRTPVSRICYRFLTLFFRIGSIMMRIISPIGLNIIIQNKIRIKVGELLKRNRYDYVLCNAKPFESFEAVKSFIYQYPKTKFIAYQTDDFVTAGDERFIPKVWNKKKLRNREDRLNQYVDEFYNYGMLESIYRKEISCILNKKCVKSMGIPLLKNREETWAGNRIKCKKEENTPIVLVFTGSLVKSFRPADETLDILYEVSKKNQMDIQIYHRGDCTDVINKYEKISCGSIKNKGTVSTKEAYEALNRADILISISNVAGDQISGKTFEYISTCKPIIHFYYAEKDMNAKILEKYRNGLNVQIKGESLLVNIQKIESFINGSHNVNVQFEEVVEIYKEYAVGSVVNALFEM